MLLGSPSPGWGGELQTRWEGVGHRCNPAGVRAGAQPRLLSLTTQVGPGGLALRLCGPRAPLRAAGRDAEGGGQDESLAASPTQPSGRGWRGH